MPGQQTLQAIIPTSLLVSILLSLCTQVHGGNIVLDQTLTRLELSAELSYLYDEDQNLNIIQVAAEETDLVWQSGLERQSELLLPSGLYWIKGRLSNPLDKPITVTLEVHPPSVHVVDLYQVNSPAQMIPLYANAGLKDRFINRPSQHRNLVNTIELPANSTQTLIWRVEDSPRLQFSVTAWKPSHFFQHDQHVQLVHGMVYGTLLVMVLYNLFLYMSTRQKSYLLYVLYVASSGYILAAEEGHIYYYLGTEQIWPKATIYSAVYALNLFVFGQFCIHFLHLSKYSTQLLPAIRILSISSALLVLLLAWSQSTPLFVIGQLAISALYVCALACGVHVRSQGVISAGHFVIAIMILVFSVVASTMATLGLIHNDRLPQNLPEIGTTMMLIFFSLALADRINQLQKENLAADDGINRANKEKLRAMSELKASQTERIRLERLANQARQENSSKSNFLANLSHEIRTPMNGVLGTTELMKSTTLTERQEHYLSTIKQSGQTLLSIIDSLQDYAKIEAGQMESEFISFNLEELIDRCISTFALASIEKNIEFVADLDPDIEPVLRGDSTKLQQILLNLLSNAFKFTDTGSIILRVKTTDKLAINRVELKFEIQDSGIGLSPQQREHLFSPFRHADESTYSRYGGSGLGLAISKQLAELMDGHIGVNSIPGEGSCFWFTARLMIDSKPASTLVRKRSGHLVGQRLLLVDSNKITAGIINRTLSAWKINVQHANNIELALALLEHAQAEEDPFSIILSQYRLDDGDVFTLANAISSHTKLSPCTFIVMATNQQVAREDSLKAKGIDLLLEKPLTFDRLHSVLKNSVTTSKDQRLALERNQLPSNNTQVPSTDKAKVLLVEDNPVNQMVLSGLLSALGICPKIATDGLQAVEMVQSERYDVVFMDCEMPGMDGFQATQHIRIAEQKSQKPTVMIVAISAHSGTEYQQQALRSGMNNYLVKPVSVADLRRVVETALSQYHTNIKTQPQQTNI